MLRFDRIQVYKDVAGGWRWRLRASNGRIIADSAEAYTNKAAAIRASERLLELIRSRIVVREFT